MLTRRHFHDMLRAETESNQPIDRIAELERQVAALSELKERLTTRESQLTHAQRLAHIGNWEADVGTGEAEWSEETFRILGLESSKSTPGYQSFFSSVHPDDRINVRRALDQAIHGRASFDVEFRIIRPDGQVRELHCVGEVEFDSAGRATRIFGTVQDITERKTIENALRESGRRCRLITETIGDVFWLSTPGVGKIVYVSPAYERIWGRTRRSLYESPKSFIEAAHPDDKEKLLAGLSRHAQGDWDYEYRIIRPDGSVRWILDRGFPVYDDEGKLVMLTGVATDITQRKETEEKLRQTLADLEQAREEAEHANRRLAESNRLLGRLALQDPLTGIANRRYLDDYLDREWRRETRHEQVISLIMIDIDFFKAYNDTLGHPAGDACLKQVAEALTGELHRPADLLARYGGEEFAVILPETTLEGAEHMAEILRRALCRLEISHPKSPIGPTVTASFGVATATPGKHDPHELIKAADTALYRAKAGGRNRVEIA